MDPRDQSRSKPPSWPGNAVARYSLDPTAASADGPTPSCSARTERSPSEASPSDGAQEGVTSTWHPPQLVGRYRIEQHIGRGGMGDVYLAYDEILRRPVAIKFIIGLDPDAATKERFLIEAHATALLQHPNVLTIFNIDEVHGRPYIVMEYLSGKTLAEVQKPMLWPKVVEIGIALARGLGAAHRRNVLHRDIKPGNVMMTDDGQVKLLDFGLAKIGTPRSTMAHPPESMRRPSLMPDAAARRTQASTTAGDGPADEPRGQASGDDAPPLTHAGALLGTPGYMAPESWRGETATPQSDVYSLGALLFELCAGRSPHADVMPHALSLAVQDRDAPLLTDLVPDVDPAFARVIARCLARNPFERYASGEHLREALERPAPGACSETVVTGNPYRRLRPFEAEHRALFFGRDTEVRTIVERLQGTSMVVVAGDSGVGKTSLCCAGVLPAVADGALDAGRRWLTVCVAPGRTPLLSLSHALAERLGLEEAAVVRWLRGQPTTLTCAICERLGTDTGLVLCVDQLEDLVSAGNAAEGTMIAEALGYLATNRSGLRLMATVRSDALHRVTALPVLGEEVSRALYFLQPLSPEGMRDAIIRSARAAGVALASETCVQIVLDSMSWSKGALPLIELVFAELWEARDTGTTAITAASLDRIGGLESALARHAEEVILGMTAVNRLAARAILTRLVGPQGAPVVRFEKDLVGESMAARAALEGLVKGRLLVSSATGQGVTYEIAHEALVRSWETLRRWLSEYAESRVVRARIGVAADVWERRGRAHTALWGDEHLAELAVIEADDLTPSELAFVRASREAIGRRSRGYRVRAPTLALAEAVQAARQRVERRFSAAMRAVGVRADDADAPPRRRGA